MSETPLDKQERKSSEDLHARADYIVRHADSIAVRVEIYGRWVNSYLAEMPPRIAIQEAFRLLLRRELPARGHEDDERDIAAMLNEGGNAR